MSQQITEGRELTSVAAVFPALRFGSTIDKPDLFGCFRGQHFGTQFLVAVYICVIGCRGERQRVWAVGEWKEIGFGSIRKGNVCWR